ncbi:MAG: hypothetical protein QOF77_2220 [Solirubrobacteraceae bacterium]|jgi:nitrite reductase/ring-hydroxylating ferredoxin subunit/uncharacterized membrane protein|nr:hypothetical protein [Solirubrobacteraceae bacterium]
MATAPQMIAGLVDGIASADQLDAITGPLAKVVGRATAPAAVKNALSGTWLGHQLHPLLTDVTIGAWVSISAVDLLGGREGARVARLLTGLGILSSVPTAASGLSDWSETYGPEQRIGLVHAAGNLAGLALQVASYLGRRRGRRGRGAALSLAGLGLAGGAGYLGGHLVYALGVGVSHTAFEHPTTDWTDVGDGDGLEESTPLRVDAAGTPVVVVRTGDRLFALSATCVHAGGPLDEGEVVDGCLRCPWHASMFRLDDGRAVRGPAALGQPVWQARIADGRLEVRAAG